MSVPFLWVKLMPALLVSGEGTEADIYDFAFLEIESTQLLVGQAVAAMCRQFPGNPFAGLVRLYVVARAAEQLHAAIAEALPVLKPLAAGAVLESCGVTSGAWLVAVLQSTQDSMRSDTSTAAAVAKLSSRLDARLDAMDSTMATFSQRLDGMDATLHSAGRRDMSPSAVLYSEVGAKALDTLKSRGAIADIPTAAGAPVLLPEALQILQDCTIEAQLVSAIGPMLFAARGFAASAGDPCAPVLINSERLRWLDSLHEPKPSRNHRKPDLFATWEPFWVGSRGQGGVCPEGKLASRVLQVDRCASEFYEAKVGAGGLTAEDFGQLVDCLSRVPGIVRGVLFNARHFWLYRSNREDPLQLLRGGWGQPGSLAALHAFFAEPAEPPLVPLLRSLRSLLRTLQAATCCPVAAAGEAEGPFLGAGATARVFAVLREGEAAPRALKVCVGVDRDALEYEFSAMCAAQAAGAPVAAVVVDSLTFCHSEEGVYLGGGYLLQHVCTHAAVTSLSRCQAAFLALQRLHEAGWEHGDARLPNLVLKPQEQGSSSRPTMQWIDMRECPSGNRELAWRLDAQTLAASIAGFAFSAPPHSIREALLDIPSGGVDAYTALALAAWGMRSNPAAELVGGGGGGGCRE
jgi:hypothetical protein